MASNNPDKNDTVANVLMPTHLKKMLTKLADDKGVNMSQLIREMIESRFRMRYNNEPACLSCEACRCPQMHIVQLATKVPAHELMGQHEKG